MSEPQIVSCPGCGKRYSVPPGVAPGQFQCQDCSSVVVYGRGGAAAEPARPERKGGASARSHAKAAAAKKKNARHRREEEEDDDRGERGRGQGGPKKQDPMIYVMAIAGLVVVGGGIAFAVSKSSGDRPKVAQGPSGKKADETPAAGITAADGTGEEAPARAPSPAPAPKPAPAPAPAPSRAPEPAEGDEAPKPSGGLKAAVRGGVQDKADPFTPAANPPSGGLYGKSQAALLLMLRDKRSDVWIDPGHLPDTAADVAAKIDADIAKMADVNGGSEFLRAQDRLVKAGRAALPKVIGLTSRLDFSKYGSMQDARDACALGDAIDNVMRGITGYDRIPMLQYSPMDGKLAQYTDSLDEWCLWWFTIGYKRETFYRKAAAPEDEKL